MKKIQVTKSTFGSCSFTGGALLMVTLAVFYSVPTATAGGYSEIHRKQDGHGNYDFGYGIKDHDHGSESFHKESGDHANNKWGSYGLKDSDGRWRIVNYVADKNGFRASIDSNEPGVGSQNPAHVIINGPASDYGHHHKLISKQHHEPLHSGYIQEYPHEGPYHNNDHYDDIGHQVDDNLDHLNIPGINGPIPGLDAIPISAASASASASASATSGSPSAPAAASSSSSSSSESKGRPEAKQSTPNATASAAESSETLVRTDALTKSNSNGKQESTSQGETSVTTTMTTLTTTGARTTMAMAKKNRTMTRMTSLLLLNSLPSSPSSSSLPSPVPFSSSVTSSSTTANAVDG